MFLQVMLGVSPGPAAGKDPHALAPQIRLDWIGLEVSSDYSQEFLLRMDKF